MASKFKVKVKIQGFELEMEGSREDVAQMSQSVGQQLSGLMKPGGTMIDGSALTFSAPEHESPKLIEKKTRRRRASSAAGGSNSSEGGHAIDFRHDSGSYGMPRQDWKTASKAIWLIYVLKSANAGDAFSTRTIVETFNKHFKQAGTITTSNVTRDLGKAKVNEKPSLVGEDTVHSPSLWYLTDEGSRRAQELVAEARGAQAQAA